MTAVVCRSMEVVVFRLVKDHAEYLVLQRSQEERVHPCMWQIITGIIEEGETAAAAAVREVGEEAGLKGLRLWNVPLVNSFYDATRDAVNMCPVFAVQVDPSAKVTLSEEHMAYQWFSRADAWARLVWPAHRQSLEIVDSYIVRGSEAAERLELRLP
jgi:dihydroneopterin triphosphate diphosphatase